MSAACCQSVTFNFTVSVLLLVCCWQQLAVRQPPRKQKALKASGKLIGRYTLYTGLCISLQPKHSQGINFIKIWTIVPFLAIKNPSNWSSNSDAFSFACGCHQTDTERSVWNSSAKQLTRFGNVQNAWICDLFGTPKSKKKNRQKHFSLQTMMFGEYLRFNRQT